MLIEFSDFNEAHRLFARHFSRQWKQLHRILTEMPLHVKSSDQAGIQGNLIFDPVGTNEFIKSRLGNQKNWTANPLIPSEFAFLGTDVDFVAGGLLVEIQFSNYPFLLNNTVRSELFFKSQTELAKTAIKGAVIVTKAKMFPASNSTLYYEQAERQLTALAGHNVFEAPIRLVGLFEKPNCRIRAVFTKYSSSRYSRTVVSRKKKTVKISPGPTERSRSKLEFAS